MMESIKGEYYGPNRVEEVTISDKKSYFGDECYDVKLDNGKTEIIPKKVLEIVMSSEKSDFTKMQDALFGVAIPQVLSILADYNMTIFDAVSFAHRLKMTIDSNFAQAKAKLFGKDYEDLATLMQVDEILKK